MKALDNIADAIADVKRTEPKRRTELVNEYLEGRVDVGPPIPGFDRKNDTLAVGHVRLGRPGWNRIGAGILARRAHFISALAEQKLWP